jgi:hypothetical protein
MVISLAEAEKPSSCCNVSSRESVSRVPSLLWSWLAISSMVSLEPSLLGAILSFALNCLTNRLWYFCRITSVAEPGIVFDSTL